MAKTPLREKLEPRFHLTEEGAVSNSKVELYCLALADGVEGATAWKNAGYRNEGGSLQYRRKVEATSEFKARMATLMAEKADLEKDPMFGEMKWMAAQLWRDARAKADSKAMLEAAQMRWKILERETQFRGAAPQAAADAPAGDGKPGRKAVENAQATSSIDAVKKRLAKIGIKPGEKPTVEEVKPPVLPGAMPHPDASPPPKQHDVPDDLQAMLEMVPLSSEAA
jgi:hypothetical protein